MTTNAAPPAYGRSGDLWRRAQDAILGGVQTLSKHPMSYAGSDSDCPVYAVRAKGARFEDVDGNTIVDYPLGLGAIILGHGHPVVQEAVAAQLADGCLFSLASPLEVELAELVCSIVPCAEKVRFFKSGSEATSAAVRVARAVTGRERIAVCGYHGWHDWTAARMPKKAGIPECLTQLVHPFEYNNLASLEAVFDAHEGQVAAVIMEPVSTEEPAPGYLEAVQALAKRRGALLIFDEMITGFRAHIGGAQAKYGVTPDLATFGKAMSNGLPIGMLAGSRAVLDAAEARVFITSTYGSDALALRASLACIGRLQEADALEHVRRLSEQLRDGLNAVFQRTGFEAEVWGLPHKTFLRANAMSGVEGARAEAAFRRECLRAGHFLGYGHFVSLSHTPEDIKQSCEAAEMVCGNLMRHLAAEGRFPGEDA